MTGVRLDPDHAGHVEALARAEWENTRPILPGRSKPWEQLADTTQAGIRSRVRAILRDLTAVDGLTDQAPTPTRPRVIPAARVAIAAQHLRNAEQLAEACVRAGVGYPVGCALITLESGGRNVYGNDPGGALAGFGDEVTEANYRVFRWLVIDRGHLSNGVGPAQITWAGTVDPTTGRRDGGYFAAMESQGLAPWDPVDNMLFGLRVLAGHRDRGRRTWAEAATLYNAGNLNHGVNAYGNRFVEQLLLWRARFAPNRKGGS